MDARLFRTRVAILWVAVAVAVSYSVLLFLLIPGALEDALAGEMEGEALDGGLGLMLAIVVGIPLVMAAVTLLLPDRGNRYVNLVAGLLFGLLGAFGMGGEVISGELNGHVLLVALGGALAFLIAAVSVVGLVASTRGRRSGGGGR